MRLKSILLLFVIFALGNASYAQEDSLRAEVKYYASLQFGLLFSCISCDNYFYANGSWAIQQGISIKDKYAIAGGIGQERYGRLRSVPIIIHLERSYNGITGKFGFAFDTGMAFLREKDDEWNWMGPMEKSRAFIMHPQFFLLAGERKTKIIMTLGYKLIYTNLEYSNWGTPAYVDMQLNRLTVNLGVRIN